MQASELKQSISDVEDQLIAQANNKLQEMIRENFTGIVRERLFNLPSPPVNQILTHAYIDVNFNMTQKTMSITSFNCTSQEQDLDTKG